jgi:hypothetical protein
VKDGWKICAGMKTTIVSLSVLGSPAFADDVLIRHLDTVLTFVGTMNAECAINYEDGIKPKARAQLNFSKTEIVVYCVCSTKLLIREMGESDFQNLAAGGDLPMKFGEPLKKARFDCAKKIWEARRGR